MPTTANGVSKFLSHHGFQRAERVHLGNRAAWLEGFRTSQATDEYDDVVLVWEVGLDEEVTEAYISELQAGGYEVIPDIGGKILIVTKTEDP